MPILQKVYTKQNIGCASPVQVNKIPVRTNSQCCGYECSDTTVKHQSEDGPCNKQSLPAW